MCNPRRDMNAIKVTVVIPVYNSEQYLPACLDSVLAQTLQDVEIITIDDASTDSSGEILDQYAQNCPCMQVVHLEVNRKQGYGRNRGINLARGKYLYFLDSDDMIIPSAMEELYLAAERESLDNVFFDARVLYETEQLAVRFSSDTGDRKGDYPDTVLKGEELYRLFTEQNEWASYVQRQFLRRDFLLEENIRFPEDVIHEDEAFNFETALLAKRVRYIRKPLFIRRYREHSIMTTDFDGNNFAGYLVSYVQMVHFVRERGISWSVATRELDRLYKWIEYCYSKVDHGDNLEKYFQEKDRDLLFLFEAFVSAREVKAEIRESLRNKLESANRIFVYGAGKISQEAVSCLASNGFAIDGIVVSDMKNNPEVLLGHRVISINELTINPEGNIMVLAMAKGYINEVRAGLELQGWSCASFRG